MSEPPADYVLPSTISILPTSVHRQYQLDFAL